MNFELPSLPYATNALEPVISERTLEVHHGRHHAGYLKALSELVDQSEQVSLEGIVRGAEEPKVFRNAAQAWSHEFYWSCMSPDGGGEPPPQLAAELEASFGSVDSFRSEFSSQAKSHFGSGWAWLTWSDGALAVETTHDAGCPLRDGHTPLLTCDLWEQAYYLDYLNERPRYIDAWWGIVNWRFADENLRRVAKAAETAA